MSWTRQGSDFNRDIPVQSNRESGAAVATRESTSSRAGDAHIGRSVLIKGTVVGKENLTIDGRVEGKIQLEDHLLTIGEHGVIEADVQARNVVVQGRVVGNVSSGDKVEIRATGSVRGDVRAPRLAIQDGATFNGSVEIGSDAATESGRPESKGASAGSTPTESK